jgi:hypothetical protein
MKTDLTEMEEELKLYVGKGKVLGAIEVQEEPAVSVKPEMSKIIPGEDLQVFRSLRSR